MLTLPFVLTSFISLLIYAILLGLGIEIIYVFILVIKVFKIHIQKKANL